MLRKKIHLSNPIEPVPPFRVYSQRSPEGGASAIGRVVLARVHKSNRLGGYGKPVKSPHGPATVSG
jgi:hypothetical protein